MGTETEMKRFNVNDHIREKMREVLISSIPDEQMDEMIKREFDAFFTREDRYGQKALSPFGVMIHDMLKDEMKTRAKKWISSNLESVWEDGEQKYIGELAASLVPIVQKRMAEDVVNNMLRALQTQS